MKEEAKAYVCCPNCLNDYKLQIIGNDYSGTEYLCAACYTEFTVEKPRNTNQPKG